MVTFEFENIPSPTLHRLAGRVAVYPPVKSLEISQDRLAEKALMTALGIPVPVFAEVNSRTDLYSGVAKTGRPAILKTRRMGYDGKGQAPIRSGDDLLSAWRAVGEAPSIVEAMVPFEREVSVILARARDGTMRAYDLPENRHVNGILAESTVPAQLPPELADEAVAIAEHIAEALGHVGVLAVEMFVLPEGNLPAAGERDPRASTTLATGPPTAASSPSSSNTSGPWRAGRSATRNAIPT